MITESLSLTQVVLIQLAKQYCKIISALKKTCSFSSCIKREKKKGKSPVGKETTNTKPDIAGFRVLVPPSPETYLRKHIL